MSDKYFEICNRNNGSVIIDDTIRRLTSIRVFNLNAHTCTITDARETRETTWANFVGRSPDTEVIYALEVEVPLREDEKVVAIKMIKSAIDPHYTVAVSVEGRTAKMYIYYLREKIDIDVLTDKLLDTIIYTFGDSAVSTEAHYGLAVYDAAGNEVFYSSDYMMNVSGDYYYQSDKKNFLASPDYYTEPTRSISNKPNDYACVVGSMRGQFHTGMVLPSFLVMWTMIFAINYTSTNINEKASAVYHAQGDFGKIEPVNLVSNILLIDVSHIPLPN